MKYLKRNTMLLFKITLPKFKYLGINLTKEVKYLYAENYKTLIKEIKEDSSGKRSHAPGLEELMLKWSCCKANYAKMA